MLDEVEFWCNECEADTVHTVEEFDAGWAGGPCVECGEVGHHRVGP